MAAKSGVLNSPYWVTTIKVLASSSEAMAASASDNPSSGRYARPDFCMATFGLAANLANSALRTSIIIKRRLLRVNSA
jgi:hypothetical protein